MLERTGFGQEEPGLCCMFVDFRWSVKFSLIMGVLAEQDDAGVSWPLSGFGVHQIDTSGSSCHTPAKDMIKWAWLDILYLMHVLYVRPFGAVLP